MLLLLLKLRLCLEAGLWLAYKCLRAGLRPMLLVLLLLH